MDRDNTVNDILDSKISPEEVLYSIQNLKNKKATGEDRISNEMLKASKDVISKHIAKLFNIVLETEFFPKMWSLGHIVQYIKWVINLTLTITEELRLQVALENCSL
jgi:translation initiation factor 2B subunit (eIF-2B alpha/beta/delta family)